MEVTNVRIRLVEGDSSEKLRAFATITLDNEFVVRDMKIIDGNSGLFIAMPSRKISVRCRKCGSKNAIRSSYCNDCGNKVPPPDESGDERRGKEHVDVAHPITQSCRDRIHVAVINAYNTEVMEARKGGASRSSRNRREHAEEQEDHSYSEHPSSYGETD